MRRKKSSLPLLTYSLPLTSIPGMPTDVVDCLCGDKSCSFTPLRSPAPCSTCSVAMPSVCHKLMPSYGQWRDETQQLLTYLNAQEQAAILGENAKRLYHLQGL